MLQSIYVLTAIAEHERLTMRAGKTGGDVRVKAMQEEEKRLKGR
ncbi:MULTISPECIES: hypothetical protein [Sporosarcina]|uniref:Resolvase/invertase-type recombinase catalytic domain-containing protein n=1 Tax=Sporosarcina saromensis TaxID=359365 RepID=A0ABU4G6B4_9BACL|nr:hypothetical protein [Sporosarcina saromensis]MDW0112486.1 hypothetical protein [Sporosarcina saromensis]